MTDNYEYYRTPVKKDMPFPDERHFPLDELPPDPKKVTVEKVIVFILLGVIVLRLLFGLCVHPINQLKVRLLLTDRYMMTIKTWYSLPVHVRCDGNSILIENSLGEIAYYTIGDEKTDYEKNFWEAWKNPQAYGFSLNGQNTSPDMALFDRSNYQRVWNEWQTWELKDGVELGAYEEVKVKTRFGRVVMHVTTSEATFYITFHHWGIVSVDPPEK